MKNTRMVSTKCIPGEAGVHLVDTTRVCFIVNKHTTKGSHYKHLYNDYIPYTIYVN